MPVLTTTLLLVTAISVAARLRNPIIAAVAPKPNSTRPAIAAEPGGFTRTDTEITRNARPSTPKDNAQNIGHTSTIQCSPVRYKALSPGMRFLSTQLMVIPFERE